MAEMEIALKCIYLSYKDWAIFCENKCIAIIKKTILSRYSYAFLRNSFNYNFIQLRYLSTDRINQINKFYSNNYKEMVVVTIKNKV